MAQDAPACSRLRLVPDQPVEGCELTPDVFLVGGVPTSSVRLEYHWYRSTEKMACSWCGKTPVTIQRLTDGAYFATAACFIAAWPGHAAQHRTGITGKGPRAEGAAIEGWNVAEGQPEQQSEQKWVEVCDTQSYTPSSDDVGHMLKLVRCPHSKRRSQPCGSLVEWESGRRMSRAGHRRGRVGGRTRSRCGGYSPGRALPATYGDRRLRSSGGAAHAKHP